jgi:predicted amidohydrolase
MYAQPKRVDANLAKASAFIDQATARGARIVALPELFNVGYFIGPELFELWEDEHGRTVSWMRDLASRHAVVIAGTIAERREGRLYNTMFIAEPSGALHRHSKRRPTVTEQAAFDAGDDDGIAVTSLGAIGQVICADMMFGATCLRPLAGNIDIVVFSQASFAPRPLARFMDWREARTARPFFAYHISALGAPMVCAGMVGPVQNVTRLIPSYLYGGTCVTDASAHVLDRVPFDREGVALADVETRRGAAIPSKLTDRLRERALADRILVRPSNLRPR